MEYPKIETLFDRDKDFKVIPTKLRNSSYGIIKRWEFTEKIDGTNIRLIWEANKLKVGGRTGNAQIPADLVQHIYESIDVQKLKDMFLDTSVIFYGEGYGAGIQKGGHYSKTKQFILFDILVDKRWWLNYDNIINIADKLGMQVVPFIGSMTLEEGVELVKNGFNSLLAKINTGEEIRAEGIVGKTCETMYDKKFNRMVIKLKTKDF